MDKKITIKLYSMYHNSTTEVQDVTWAKDTLNVVIFAISYIWQVKDHFPTLWLGQKELTDLTEKSVKDLGIKDGDWLAVGWRHNDDSAQMLIEVQ